jgi:hypothetical protein
MDRRETRLEILDQRFAANVPMTAAGGATACEGRRPPRTCPIVTYVTLATGLGE